MSSPRTDKIRPFAPHCLTFFSILPCFVPVFVSFSMFVFFLFLIDHHSSPFLLILHHFFLIIPLHSSSFSLILPHFSSSFPLLLLTPSHSSSLLLIPPHSFSFFLLCRSQAMGGMQGGGMPGGCGGGGGWQQGGCSGGGSGGWQQGRYLNLSLLTPQGVTGRWPQTRSLRASE